VAAGAAADSITFARSVEIRFRAQIHVLTVPFDTGEATAADVNAMVERFVEVYEGRFGKGAAFLEGGVEITTFRVVATSPVPKAEFDTGALGAATGEPGVRRVFCGGEWRDATVYRAEQLRDGLHIEGLAIVELRDTTVVSGPDQDAEVDGTGDIVIRNR
jgi:N-methylhydantoinase A